MQLHGITGQPDEKMLLGPRATALNQNSQDNDNQHSCNNPNNKARTHMKSSFLNQNV
jgi:hypothetical protein